MGLVGSGAIAPLGAQLAILAGCLAVVSGGAFGDFAYRTLQRRKAASAMLADGRNARLVLRLKGGVPMFREPSLWLMSKVRAFDDAMDDASILLSEAGLDFTKAALGSILLGASALALVVGTFVGSSLILGIAAACILFVGFIAFVRNRADRQNALMREEVPEALRSLAMSFRSGHSLPQVLASSAKDCDGYLAHLFSVASDRLEMGANPSEALSVMRGNSRVPELSFVAVALDVQHESGGSMAPVLESAIESVNGELRLARSLRVQTAQAKLSASIVTAMPFVLVFLFSLMSPDFLSPFFSSVLGMAVLAVALVMQVSGVLIVRRMLKVDIG